MKFQMGDKEYMLHRDKVPGYSFSTVSSEQLCKFLNKTSQISMVQCFNLQVECRGTQEQNIAGNKAEKVSSPLQKVLACFKDVFEEPVGLPPHRK